MYLQKAKVNISQHCRAEQRKDKGPTHQYLENEEFIRMWHHCDISCDKSDLKMWPKLWQNDLKMWHKWWQNWLKCDLNCDKMTSNVT